MNLLRVLNSYTACVLCDWLECILQDRSNRLKEITLSPGLN